MRGKCLGDLIRTSPTTKAEGRKQIMGEHEGGRKTLLGRSCSLYVSDFLLPHKENQHALSLSENHKLGK